MIHRWVLILLVLVLSGTPVWGQDSTAGADSTREWHDGAWTRIIERDGLDISYIFYSEADNVNNGVVLRLHNRNDYPVRYAFTVIFRGPKAQSRAPVEGTLKAGEMLTGDENGLFWVPFDNRRRIGEVGLRDIEVRRLRTDDSFSQRRG